MSLTAHGPVMANGAFPLEKLWIMMSKETSLEIKPSLAHLREVLARGDAPR